MQKTVKVTKTINVSAKDAWAVIRTGENLDLWFSAITSCRRDGNKRVCTMAGGGEVFETIAPTDDEEMIFTYVVDSHPLPVGPVNSSIQVSAATSKGCDVIWTAIFDGQDAPTSEVAMMLEGLYAQGITSLETYVMKAA